MAYNREQFINRMVARGVDPSNYNNALTEAGFEPLSRSEIQMAQAGTLGTSIAHRAKQDIVDIGQGLSSLLGAGGRWLTDSDFRNKVNTQVKNYVTTHTPGQMAYDLASKGFVEPLTGGIELGEALVNPKEAIQQVGATAIAHPGLTATYLLPEIAKGTGAVTKTVSKLLPEESIIRRGMGFTGPTQEVNQILSASKYAKGEQIENLRGLQTKVAQASDADLAQAIKNAETGTWEGSAEAIQLTKDLQSLSHGTRDLTQKAGLYRDEAKLNTVAQYIARKLDSKTPIKNIETAIKTGEGYDKLGITKEQLDKLVLEGYNLEGKGLIFHVPHKTTATTAREGLIEEAVKKGEGRTAKLYGTQKYEDLVQGLKEEGFTPQLNKLEKAEGISTSIDEMLKSGIGRKVTSVENLKPNEVVISPSLLKEKLGTSLHFGEDLTEDIKSLSRGLNKAEKERYANDLYVLSKDDLNALERAYTSSGGILGNSTLRQASTIAKQTALATPRYIAGNALANALLNPITGVKTSHYIDALGKYKDYIPDVLKRSTTYTGYLGSQLPVSSSIGDIYRSLMQKVKTGSPMEKATAVASMVNTPFFRTAGNAETIQRAASFVNEAEKYAKRVGKTTEEILKEASKNGGNNKLGRNLLYKTQQYLGDYTGRNYYLPQQINEIGDLAAPFIRPYVQGVRQMFNIYKDHRGPATLMSTLPSRLGDEWRRKEEQELRIGQDATKGAFPLEAPYWRTPGRSITSPYHVFTAVSDLLDKPTETLGGNQFISTLINPIAGKNRFGKDAMLPNEMQYQGQKVILDNNGNVMRREDDTISQRLQLLASEYLNTLTPISGVNSYMLPTLSALLGKDYYRPSDYSVLGQIGDFKIPGLMEGQITQRPKQGVDEKLMPLTGFTYSNVYNPRGPELTLKQQKQYKKQMVRKQLKNERR